MFRSIQYLRGIAALMVVLHHACQSTTGSEGSAGGFNIGQAGVDIFFVISGFIMYSMARDKTVSDFLWDRIIRIVPMYWIATFVLIVIEYRGNISNVKPNIGWHIAESLFFIPHYSPINPGQIWPYVIPGWTLNYEMFFYVIFSVGLLIYRPLMVVSITMALLVVLGFEFTFDDPRFLTYTNPIVIEFVFGLMIAKYRERIAAPAAIALLPLGVLALVLSEFIDAPRVLAWGLPASLILIGAMATEQTGRLPNAAALVGLGDASYSIYLFQKAPLLAAAKLSGMASRSPDLAFALKIFLSLSLSSIVGLLIYKYVERPILTAGKRIRLSVRPILNRPAGLPSEPRSRNLRL